MYELTISTSLNKYKDINFIVNCLRNFVKQQKGIMVCEQFNQRFCLAIAVDEKKKDYLIGNIFDAVSETIINSYKEDFLRENIDCKIFNRITFNTLIKVLTMFDKSGDKQLIKSKLSSCTNINLDSLYNFKLWDLKRRWLDICDLVNENSQYILINGTFLDLMRFLILDNETENQKVHLKCMDQHVYGISDKGSELFKCSYNGDDDSVINVLSELILLSPQKIIVDANLINDELNNYLSELFYGKVSYLK